MSGIFILNENELFAAEVHVEVAEEQTNPMGFVTFQQINAMHVLNENKG